MESSPNISASKNVPVVGQGGVSAFLNSYQGKIIAVALASIAIIAALVVAEVKYGALSVLVALAVANPITSIVIALFVVGTAVYVTIRICRKPEEKQHQQVGNNSGASSNSNAQGASDVDDASSDGDDVQRQMQEGEDDSLVGHQLHGHDGDDVQSHNSDGDDVQGQMQEGEDYFLVGHQLRDHGGNGSDGAVFGSSQNTQGQQISTGFVSQSATFSSSAIVNSTSSSSSSSSSTQPQHVSQVNPHRYIYDQDGDMKNWEEIDQNLSEILAICTQFYEKYEPLNINTPFARQFPSAIEFGNGRGVIRGLIDELRPIFPDDAEEFGKRFKDSKNPETYAAIFRQYKKLLPAVQLELLREMNSRPKNPDDLPYDDVWNPDPYIDMKQYYANYLTYAQGCYTKVLSPWIKERNTAELIEKGKALKDALYKEEAHAAPSTLEAAPVSQTTVYALTGELYSHVIRDKEIVSKVPGGNGKTQTKIQTFTRDFAELDENMADIKQLCERFIKLYENVPAKKRNQDGVYEEGMKNFLDKLQRVIPNDSQSLFKQLVQASSKIDYIEVCMMHIKLLKQQGADLTARIKDLQEEGKESEAQAYATGLTSNEKRISFYTNDFSIAINEWLSKNPKAKK